VARDDDPHAAQFLDLLKPNDDDSIAARVLGATPAVRAEFSVASRHPSVRAAVGIAPAGVFNATALAVAIALPTALICHCAATAA
jgi:hypothetical protein